MYLYNHSQKETVEDSKLACLCFTETKIRGKKKGYFSVQVAGGFESQRRGQEILKVTQLRMLKESAKCPFHCLTLKLSKSRRGSAQSFQRLQCCVGVDLAFKVKRQKRMVKNMSNENEIF